MADEKAPSEPVRPLAATQDKDGNIKAGSVLSPDGFKARGLIHAWREIVIPVVFVPGVMGTNLKVKGDSAVAWAAPTGILKKIGALLEYWKQDAAKRQEILNQNTTEVDPNGSLSVRSENDSLMLAPGKGKTPEEVARWRGWGELHEESYSDILNSLERQLSHMLEDGEPAPFWREHVLQPSPEQMGARKPWQPLTVDELKKAAKASYPVHACGYNWLQCNRESGKRLKERIQGIIKYYKDLGHTCEKVILVTHSMGGLASRACVKMAGGEDLVIGILHGVMPAIGAPAAYKRMRAGFEHAESVILGRDAAEAAPVLGNSPAGLELLPTTEYFTKIEDKKRQWLLATGNGKDTLLGVGDPYETIYRDQNPKHWWRMVKVELLNPLGRKKKEEAAKKEAEKNEGKKDGGEKKSTIKENPRATDGDFKSFSDLLNIAKGFHEELKGKYHTKTYSFYAADAAHASWNEVQWLTKDAADAVTEGEIVEDNLKGKLTIQLPSGPAKFKVEDPKGRGDGTVPEESGEAPLDASIQCFRHEGAEKGHTSYDHQYCYSNSLTKGVSLYCIAKLANTSPLLNKA